jgi:hypothetical protein
MTEVYADFGDHNSHQPLGLMSPETILQTFGATNCTQLLHWLEPLGLV